MNRYRRFVTCALPILLAACMGAPALDADDAAIYAVVLEDLSARKDNMLLSDGVLLIASMSSAIDGETNRLPYQGKDAHCRPDASLDAALAARNTAEAKIASAIVVSPRWRIATDQELDTPLYMQHETTRSIVRLKQPGVSADRREALVLLSFLWSEHVADAVYLLRRVDDVWQITCSDLLFHP